MLAEALTLDGPSVIRFPTTPPRHVAEGQVGHSLSARRVRSGDGSVCLIGVGKMLAAAEEAAVLLAAEGIDVTIWDPRVISPPDPTLLADAADHDLVVTAEDGVRFGGAGMFLTDAVAAWADGEDRRRPAVVNLGIPRAYVPQGRADDLLSELGLDGPGVAASVRALVDRLPVLVHRPARRHEQGPDDAEAR